MGGPPPGPPSLLALHDAVKLQSTFFFLLMCHCHLNLVGEGAKGPEDWEEKGATVLIKELCGEQGWKPLTFRSRRLSRLFYPDAAAVETQPVKLYFYLLLS